MKRLLLGALFLFAAPVWGVTALDIGFACDESVQNVTSATYIDAADTLVFTPGATADFIIIAHASVETSNADTAYSIQLNHDSGTGSGVVWEYDTDQLLPFTGAQDHYGSIWNFLDQRNLDNASHTFSIEVKRTAGTGNVEVENVCIVALEKSANAEYAEQLTLQDTGTSTVNVTMMSLTFTATAEEYVIFQASHFGQELDSANRQGIEFVLSGGQEFCIDSTMRRDGNDEAADPSPILVGHSVGCLATETLAAGSVTFILQAEGDGIAGEMFMQRGAIFAMPSAEFESFYGVEATAESARFNVAPVQDDSGLGSITQTLAAQTHLMALTVGSSNESANDAPGTSSYCLIDVDGTDHSDMRFPGDRDEDQNNYYNNWVLWAETFASSASRTVKSQCASSLAGGNNQAAFNNRRLIVAEIPADAGGAPRRRISVTIGAD